MEMRMEDSYSSYALLHNLYFYKDLGTAIITYKNWRC